MDVEGASKLSRTGYNCPQCGGRYCELPVECKQCSLTLVSAPHLARSYHHLFPLKPFAELTRTSDMKYCFTCAKLYGENEKLVSHLDKTDPYNLSYWRNEKQGSFLMDFVINFQVYQCGNCRQIVCLDCDLFIRETLHTCPGCASDSRLAQMN